MIKMVIADDESVIIRGIGKLLDWQGLGIEIVGEFSDGRQALDGILALRPEIALLDISMPGLSGIEVLKELRAQHADTKVVFISGFQDFAYAQDAVRYGAVDYLLKPVIREELLRALEKCVPLRQKQQEQSMFPQDKDFSVLLGMEQSQYLTMTAHPLLAEEDAQLAQLKRFSVLGLLEERVSGDGRGIEFEKDGTAVVILKGMERPEALDYARRLAEEICADTGVRLCLLAAGLTDSLKQVREAYGLCCRFAGVAFFAPWLKQDVFDLEELAQADGEEQKAAALSRLMRAREALSVSLLKQREEEIRRDVQDLWLAVSRACAWSAENASYLLCSSLRQLEGRLSEAGISCEECDYSGLFETFRRQADYVQMCGLFQEELDALSAQVRSAAAGGEKSEIARASEYIAHHFAEPLTLEILAGVVHMNPYYCSSWFKKNMGTNFKDYLGQVRLNHAVSLLLSTDKLAYEIAEESGFADARAFSDLFQKTYGEKPSAYRKRLRGH